MITTNFEKEKAFEEIQKFAGLKDRISKGIEELSFEDQSSIVSRIAKSEPVRVLVKRTYDLIQTRNIPKFQRLFKEWQEKVLIPAERKAIRKVFGQVSKAELHSMIKADPGSVANTVTARVVSSMKPEYVQEEGLRILKPGYTAAVVDGANGAYRLVGIQAQFDVLKPEAVQEINRIGADLVVEITEDQKLAIRSIVKEGIIAGKSMPMIARDLDGTCGLFTRWRFAAMRYEMSLFAQGLPDKIVREKGKRYYDHLLRRRRLMIARTETGIAQAQGSLLGYKSIGVQEVRFYAAHGACEICASMDGNVYKIEEAAGIIPVHPNGRCDWLAVSPKDGFKKPTALPAPPSLDKGISNAISSVMARYGRRKVEHCSAISKTGESFFTKSGTETRIHFTEAEMTKMRGVTEVFIHNHPNSGSFSGEDIRFALDIKTDRLIVCSDLYRYNLRPAKGCKFSPSLPNLANRRWRLLHWKYQRKYDAAVKDLEAKGVIITQEISDKIADEQNIERAHELWDDLIKNYEGTEYALDYKVTKIQTGG